MQFLTPAECAQWLADRNRVRPAHANSPFRTRIDFPKAACRFHWFSHQIAQRHGEPCLMWLEEWGIWDQNLHLYYRLRESYGDRRLLEDAPGHLFLGHEAEDLATMLQVAMLNGWGGYVLAHMNYVNAYFSHDEYIDLFSDEQSLIESLKSELTQ